MGLCEHLQRDEQLRNAKIAADEENASLRKKVADLEETLRSVTEGADQRLEAVKAEGRAEGKTEAETVAREAAQAAAEATERAKIEAVGVAEKSTVDAFVAEGWMAEDRNEWVSSVVE
ncbi:unnamed protein product [Cuscuta europaea]|uniref:Uncharacterized protein n=1 Tax=Cuscuta europaea TaxID=41803 RepID=A0A9P0ZNK5_CUSEU|nr:unnamed protein product [Cuscuta europaea]